MLKSILVTPFTDKVIAEKINRGYILTLVSLPVKPGISSHSTSIKLLINNTPLRVLIRVQETFAIFTLEPAYQTVY